jgi:hypothetical protein
VRLANRAVVRQRRGPSVAADGLTRRQILAGVLGAVIAIGAGVAVTVSPLSLAVIGGLIVAAWLVGIGRRSVAAFHSTLVILLTGYAFLGKGFAYFGFPPLYVGEFCLAISVLAILYSIRQARFNMPLLFLVLFMVWGALRTVPYIGTYGLLAFRDGVTWEYGLFAVAVGLSVQREHLDRVVEIYRRGAQLLVWWLPVASILTIVGGHTLPRFPGSPVSFVFIKQGDSGVQLAAIAAFVLVGLFSARHTSQLRTLWLWAGWFISAGFTALNRGGMLSIAAAAVCLAFVFSVRRLLTLAFVGTAITIMLLAVNPEVDFGLARKISVGQVVDNFTSLASGDSEFSLQTTKDWRLAWWGKIYGYTVNGPYFWVGKGFGANLATEDGFQIADESLRAPHDTHIEILARAGVPGVALWVLFQIAYAIALLRAATKARRINEPIWIMLIGWVFVYWLAALVNASFDVYLGGPQGGIWFWSMVGLGLAVIRMVNERASSGVQPPSQESTGELGVESMSRLRPSLRAQVDR